MRLIRNHVFVPLAVLVVLAVCNPAVACSIEVTVNGDYVAKGEDPGAYLELTFVVTGAEGGTIDLESSVEGGKVQFRDTGYNTIKFLTVADAMDDQKHFWVEGITVSDAVEDVSVTAILKDSEGEPQDYHGDMVTVIEVDLDIDGVADGDEVSVGGLVVRRFDGNDAPRKKITIQPVKPNDWTGDVVLTESEGDEKIKVFTTLTGDTEITFTGGDNKFANPDLVQNPKDLYVQGDAASGSMRDIELKAEPEGVPKGPDRVKFTVLWVDISWTRLSTDEVPQDNSRLGQYITVTGDDKLGLLDDTVTFRRWSYQIKGQVSPDDFDQNEEIDWDQDVQGRFYENNGFIGTRMDFSPQFPPGNDAPFDSWQDKAPQSGGSGGKVYFLDGPSLFRDSAKPIDTVRRLRGNFKAAALYTGHGYTDQRCSEIWTHYVRFSMKKTDAPPGNTWVDPADVANDKQANSGSFTRLSWDLNSPTVTAITPNNGTNDGTVNITNLAGTSFVDGATVKLTKAGQDDIVATNPSYQSVTKITCTFDLTGKAVGDWNVVVINPADESNPGTLANGFTISEP